MEVAKHKAEMYYHKGDYVFQLQTARLRCENMPHLNQLYMCSESLKLFHTSQQLSTCEVMVQSLTRGGESSTEQSTTSSCSQTPTHGDNSSTLHSTPASGNASNSTAFPDSASSTAGATASSSEVSAVSPSPVVYPLDSQNSSGVFCSTPTLNPLV